MDARLQWDSGASRSNRYSEPKGMIMQLVDYGRVLRDGWLLLVIGVVLGALIGWAVSSLQPRQYTSTTGVYVSITDGTDPTSLYQMGEYMRSQMVSYAELAEKPIVLDPVVEQLGGEVSTEKLTDMVSVDLPSESYIMEIKASSADAQLSSAASLAIAESLENEVEAIAPQYSDQSLIDLSVVDPAQPAAEPDSVPTGLWVGGGAVLGLLAGLLLAFMRYSARESRSTARTASSRTGA